ncbi:uncharacterized protein LOC134727652 [Mytilus trossulus]|uniref:uncharacterized protein LOC134727652 n=1 Tax=Mytilus trossulus TaxID=6551 RepID=UPI0030055E1A
MTLRHKLRKLQQKVKRGAETESDSDGLVFDISPYKAPVKKPAKRKLPVTTVEQATLITPVTLESKGTQTLQIKNLKHVKDLNTVSALKVRIKYYRIQNCKLKLNLARRLHIMQKKIKNFERRLSNLN